MADLTHHKQQELCKTRPAYRQGRNLTAVKVRYMNTICSRKSIYISLMLESYNKLFLCGNIILFFQTYTINQESQHLYIYGVPTINLRIELKNLCTKYGQIKTIHVVPNIENEQFTECYHVQYERIQSARIAKRMIDSRSFYGGVLHVCYAPECESLQETRAKLQQRKRDVLKRLPRKPLESSKEKT